MEKVNDFCIVFITTETFESAQHISRIIVSEQLAACCTILPNATSIYGWNGAITETHEYQMLIKTKKSKLDVLESRIAELHPYEIPEIVAIDVSHGSKSYLNWVESSLVAGSLND